MPSTIILDPRAIGQGWIPVAPFDDKTPARIQTLDQWYDAVETNSWMSSSYLTSDAFTLRMNVSSANYRRPVSFGARVSAIWAAKGKLWRRWVMRKGMYE